MFSPSMVFGFLLNFFTVPYPQQCNLKINLDLNEPQPLIFSYQANSSNGLLYPENEDKLTIQTNHSLRIACPNGNIKLNNQTTFKSNLNATCMHDQTFFIDNQKVIFNNITCTNKVKATARYTKELCENTMAEIEVGFTVEKSLIRHLTICFNKSNQNTIYSHSNLTYAIAGIQKGYPRRLFTIGNFYDVKPYTVHQLYRKDFQRKTLNKLLGHNNESLEVIPEKGNYFLSRGHLSPKADFIYGSQQSLTFFYVNTAPQWQSLNGGNWLVLEKACRNFAIERKLNLQIFTGTHSVATLLDINNNPQELYLYRYKGRRALPVPKYFWKVLYEPLSQAGVAFVSVNNPYYNVTKGDLFCDDICNMIKWIQWERNNTYLGYSFCCTIDSFRQTVNTLPTFHVKNLLI